MIEPIMFIGIGFLVAGLLVIGVIPLVHARAVRLTMHRLEASNPVSMAEIQAEKDQLRAEFAMSTRRLEMTVEQMKAKTTNLLAEIGKKSEAIGRLKLELGEKTAALFALEAREKQMADNLESIQAELAAKASGLQAAERALAGTQGELANLTSNLDRSSVASDSQRVELVTLRAQTEILKAQIEASEEEITNLRERLTREAGIAETASRQLGEERARTQELSNRVGELDRQLLAQTTESEILGRRVQELTTRLDEQGRLLADREYASGSPPDEAALAKKTEADLRTELTEAQRRHRFIAEAIRAEKKLVEDELRASQEERDKLLRELAAVKRESEASTTERAENAVLRERINDVAAEVARLTASLEGPDSPIEAILKKEAGRPQIAVDAGTGEVPPLAPSGGESKVTLADRIRALQGRAARLTQASGA